MLIQIPLFIFTALSARETFEWIRGRKRTQFGKIEISLLLVNFIIWSLAFWL